MCRAGPISRSICPPSRRRWKRASPKPFSSPPPTTRTAACLRQKNRRAAGPAGAGGDRRSYIEFTSQGGRLGEKLSACWKVPQRENLVVLRTFSKWAGLAGLRVGYGAFPAGCCPRCGRPSSPITSTWPPARPPWPRCKTWITWPATWSASARNASGCSKSCWRRSPICALSFQANFILCQVLGRSGAGTERRPGPRRACWCATTTRPAERLYPRQRRPPARQRRAAGRAARKVPPPFAFITGACNPKIQPYRLRNHKRGAPNPRARQASINARPARPGGSAPGYRRQRPPPDRHRPALPRPYAGADRRARLFDLYIRPGRPAHRPAPHHGRCGLALGSAFQQALGDKAGIVRMASADCPMDESLAWVSSIFPGGPTACSRWIGTVPALAACRSRCSPLPGELCVQARCNLHAAVRYGRDDHHQAEAIFKALAGRCAPPRALTRAAPGRCHPVKGSYNCCF
jgi:hypothetical protein